MTNCNYCGGTNLYKVTLTTPGVKEVPEPFYFCRDCKKGAAKPN